MDIDKIEEVASLKKRITEIENKLIKPSLKNPDHLYTLKEWFDELSFGVLDFPKKDSIEYRERFLFVVMCLYSPGVLIGYTMVLGLRTEVARMYNVSACVISNNIKNLSFYYKTYPKFKRDVDFILPEIMLRVELSEMK